MDLVTEARVNRINELAASVLADARLQARRYVPGMTARLGLSRDDLRQYSLTRVIQYQLGKSEGGFEFDCHRELEKRFELPLSTFAIPLDVLEHRALYPNQLVGVSAPQDLSFIEMLRNQSIAYRLGVQRITDLKDNVAIPRQITDATLAWMAPNGSVTASESSFGQVSATPRTAVAITEVTEQLLLQASADRIIMAGLAAVMTVRMIFWV